MAQERFKPGVTVGAIIERDGRFLLVEEQTADGLRLNTPAGHLDPSESPVDAVFQCPLGRTDSRVPGILADQRVPRRGHRHVPMRPAGPVR